MLADVGGRIVENFRAWNRYLDPFAPQSRKDMQANRRIGPVFLQQVGDPVAHDVFDCAWIERPANARRPRIPRNIGQLGPLQCSIDSADHAARRPFITDAEFDRPAQRDAHVSTSRQHVDASLHQHRIGNDQRLVVVGRQCGIAPTNADDLSDRPLPYHAFDANPISDVQRVVELHRKSAPKIGKRLFERCRDTECCGARYGQDPREIDAHRAHAIKREYEQR